LVDREDIILFVAEKYRRSAFFRMLGCNRRIWSISSTRLARDGSAHGARRRLVIAPEGTRSPTGNLQRAQSGAGFLAAKSGVPIVPTAIRGTEDAEVKARLRRLRRLEIVVTFGKPFYLPQRPGVKAKAGVEAMTTRSCVESPRFSRPIAAAPTPSTHAFRNCSSSTDRFRSLQSAPGGRFSWTRRTPEEVLRRLAIAAHDSCLRASAPQQRP
jgi:hypothetical protein